MDYFAYILKIITLCEGRPKYVCNFQTNYAGRHGYHRLSFYCENVATIPDIAVVCYSTDKNIKEQLKYISDFLDSDIGDQI